MGRPRPVAQRENRAGQRAFHAEIARVDRATASRLANANRAYYAELRTRLAVLQDVSGELTSARQLAGNPALIRLKDEVKATLDDMSKQIAKEAARGQQAGIIIGRNAGIAQMDTVTAAFNRPSVETVQRLVNYVDSFEFRQTLNDYPDYHAQHISDIVLADTTQGRGVDATVRHIRQYLQTYPLADAQRMVRTVTLYSARQASHEIYRQNADIVSGWRWSATLDKRVCMSCVMQHGKVFPLTATCNDHHNGRCAPVPVTRYTDPVKTGEAWFNDLPESEQRQMLGPSAFSAWKDGAFKLPQISTTYHDPVYGQMRRAASLQELIGQDAAQAYRRPPQNSTIPGG